MNTVTISTQAGKTITTDSLTEAKKFVFEHADADPITASIDSGRFWRLMRMNNWLEAGNLAGDLGLHFAIANAPREYVVPVDPDDATNCETCQ